MADGKIYSATLERVFDAPRSLVWALVSDTNRSDRALGLAPAAYRWEGGPDGARRRVATARELGVALEWVEPPYEWVEGQLIEGRRTFIKGPVQRGGFSVHLSTDDEGQTVASACAFVEASGALGMVLGPVQKAKFRRSLRAYFDALDEALRGWRQSETGTADEPAALHARRLLARGYEPLTRGPRSSPDERVLTVRADRLRSSPVDSELIGRLLEHLRTRPDEEVQQMRPFELARIWNVDKRSILQLFLHATVAGLVDLRWQINCPVCRVGASVVSDLASVEESSHCDACEIRYDVDFAKHVEAVFPCNAAVRPVQTALYCASSPAFLPHVYAQLSVGRELVREERFELPAGALHLRTLGRDTTADITLEHAPARLTCRIEGGALHVDASGHSEDGLTQVAIENTESTELQLLIERSDWSADAVLGTVIASFPEFVDLFATEAPAAGVELSVGHLALLFSDLVGSTALYERIGDARAFAVVEDHFREMALAVQANGGTIVKTMGDAVMAVFPSSRLAVQAAREMVERHDRLHDAAELGVKVGVFAGPCLAVRANDRLDYFGTTVNMAARLQAKAGASELVVTAELAQDLADLFDDVPSDVFVANLKGIREDQKLVRLRYGALAATPPRVVPALE